jgi:hypothetical protein
MARKKNKSQQIVFAVLITFGGLAIGAAVTYMVLGSSNRFAALPSFPIDSYLEGGGLWSDEEYKIEGRVDNVLLRSDDKRVLLVSIQPIDSDRRIPVLVIRGDKQTKPIQREQDIVIRAHLGASREIIGTDYATP